MLISLALIATAALFGGMVGFSFLFAPLVFAKLPAETAGRFIREVFPRYYLCIAGVGSLAALLLIPDRPVLAVVLFVVAAGGVVARQGLMPAINRARDRQIAGEAEARRRFSALHGASVVLNLIQIAALAAVLAALAP